MHNAKGTIYIKKAYFKLFTYTQKSTNYPISKYISHSYVLRLLFQLSFTVLVHYQSLCYI